MMTGLSDRVAIITGAAQGIGLATAEQLARHGAICAMVDRNADELEKAVASIKAIEPRAAGHVMDVTSKQQWVQTISTVQEQFGAVDMLVNNAAAYDMVPFEQVSEAQWDHVFAVNVKGVLFGCQAVAPFMRQQKCGRIVNMASQAGKTGGLIIGAHYSASKAAVICMTKTFAASLGRDNVTVNSVAPGIIDTPFRNAIPGIEPFFERIVLGHKPGQASDVANSIVFLLSDAAAYITGEIIDVNGGLLMD